MLECTGRGSLLLSDRHLRGWCAFVDVGHKSKLLVRLHDLLHFCSPQRVEFCLPLLLLLGPNGRQSSDILLAHALCSLAKLSLLQACVDRLRAQSANALCKVLADTELLRSQIANALAKLLLKLRLLTKDVGLLPCDVGLLARQTGLLASQSAIQARGALTKLSLLQFLASQLLAHVSSILSGLQCLVSTLCFHGAKLGADLSSLTCGSQAQLALLASSGQLCLTHVLSKARSLHTKAALLRRKGACRTSGTLQALPLGQLPLLLLLKRLLGLLLSRPIALLQCRKNGLIPSLLSAALKLCPLNRVPRAAESASASGLRLKALLLNVLLAVYLLQCLINNLLLVRVHESLSRGRIVALCRALECADAHSKGLFGLSKAGLIGGSLALRRACTEGPYALIKSGLVSGKCCLFSSARQVRLRLAKLGPRSPGLIDGFRHHPLAGSKICL